MDDVEEVIFIGRIRKEITAGENLDKAWVMFEEMDLKWDQQLEKVRGQFE